MTTPLPNPWMTGAVEAESQPDDAVPAGTLDPTRYDHLFYPVPPKQTPQSAFLNFAREIGAAAAHTNKTHSGTNDSNR